MRRYVYTSFASNGTQGLQVLDATLKEITAALLESDVNVKLVASLRSKVKTKVKAIFEGGDKTKDVNRKNVIQKVRTPAVPHEIPSQDLVRQYSMSWSRS